MKGHMLDEYEREYEDLLKRAGMSKGRLAAILGVHPTTVARWREPPGPVMAYLRLYVAVREALN